MDCVILTEARDLWNTQRLFLPASYINIQFGKYAIVALSEHEKYICRVYGKNCLCPGFCMLDKTVFVKSTRYEECSEILQINNIQYISQINYIKILNVTVLFESPKDTVRWKSCVDCLCPYIKDLLRLFVLVNNCSVRVNKLKCAKLLKVHCIIVNNVGNMAAGKVVDTTKLEINCIMSNERYKQRNCIMEKQPLSYFNAPFNTLTEFLTCQEKLSALSHNLFSRLSAQILIVGPAGCGKKTLVKKFASDQGIVLLTLNLAEVFRPETGESEAFLKQRFQESIYYTEETDGGRCILFLQNLDVVGKKSGRILATILSILDDVQNHPGLAVVAATDKPHLFHRSLCSQGRFNTQIYIDIPTEPERIDILKYLLSNFNISEETLKEIAKLTPGFVISDLVLLVQNVYRQMNKKKKRILENDEELLEMMQGGLKIVEASALRGELGVVRSSTADGPIGGLKNVKLALEQAVHWPLNKPEAFVKLNIQQNTGVLLYGPPGCAKTSLACNIANTSKCTFLSVSAADLYSPYVGDAERTISHLFQRVRAASPTVLFIDEIDALVGSREGREKGSHERVLSAFLTEMDGVGSKRDFESSFNYAQRGAVFVIAATNRPNVLDSALLRAGRFDRLIYVPAPNKDERLDILEKITTRMPLGDCVDLELIAEKTNLFSGADLKNLCREAALNALTEDGMKACTIKQNHFFKALSEVNPSLTIDQVKWFEKFCFSSS